MNNLPLWSKIVALALLCSFQTSYSMFSSLSSASTIKGSAVVSAGAVSTVATIRAVAQHRHANTPLINLSADLDPVLPANAPVAILLCHGFGASGQASAQAYRSIINKNVKIYAVDFPSSTRNAVNPLFNAHFAQDGNIEHIIGMYLKMVRDGYRVILWGFSDGAASVVTTMGTYNLNNIAAVVARSPYSAIEHVTSDLAQKALNSTSLPRLVTQPSASAVGHSAASTASSIAPYSYMRGVRPIDVVHKINKPTLFIASSKDELVRPERTKQLYQVHQGVNTHNCQARYAELNVPVRGGHNDFLVEPMVIGYTASVAAFLHNLGINNVINSRSRL